MFVAQAKGTREVSTEGLMASVTLTEGKMIPVLAVSFPLADWVQGREGPAL